jgi:hypothetical protein
VKLNRTTLRIAGAVVALLAAALFVAVALDAHAWGTRIPADDLRFHHDALSKGLWQPEQRTPLHLTQHVLGIGNDLTYRNALRAFRVGRPLDPLTNTTTAARRIRAQIELQDFIEHSNNSIRRSQASNLVGVLAFAAATQDVSQRITFLNNAIAAFRTAIELDPTNDDALFNLEYALGQLKEAAEQQAGPNKRLGSQGGAGLAEPGHGY